VCRAALAAVGVGPNSGLLRNDKEVDTAMWTPPSCGLPVWKKGWGWTYESEVSSPWIRRAERVARVGCWLQATALVTETSRTFTWGSGESSSYFKYMIDDGVTSFTTEESMAFASGSFAVSSCSGTSHSFAVAAIDAVGNVGSYKTKAFTVEPINTALTLDNAAVETTVSGTSATFSVSAVVDTSSTTSFTFQYALRSEERRVGKECLQRC
jgi:hypothetical protein